MRKLTLEVIEGKGICVEDSIGSTIMSVEMADTIFNIPAGWDGTPIVAEIEDSQRFPVKVAIGPYAIEVNGEVSIVLEDGTSIPYLEEGISVVHTFEEEGVTHLALTKAGVPVLEVGITEPELIVDPTWIKENLRS